MARFHSQWGLQQCRQGGALYFPHLDDLLVTIYPEVREVLPLHLLLQLLFIIFKFLLVVGRQTQMANVAFAFAAVDTQPEHID